MVEIDLKMHGTNAVLDFGQFALDAKSIEDRVRQILPLLQWLIEADLVEISLAEPVLQKRFRGIAAQSLMVEAALLSVVGQAELLVDIASGHESIADHGFPEFGDE